MFKPVNNLICCQTGLMCRAVIKGRGPGIFSGYYERGPRLLSQENRSKIEPKETPSCFFPRLLVVFTRQLEILVTTLGWWNAQHRYSTRFAAMMQDKLQVFCCPFFHTLRLFRNILNNVSGNNFYFLHRMNANYRSTALAIVDNDIIIIKLLLTLKPATHQNL